jgi:HSP20 family protein
MYVSLYRPATYGRHNSYPFSGLVDSVLADAFASTRSIEARSGAVLEARFDVVEKADRYEAYVELPGAAKDDIEVNVEGARVSIRAQSKNIPVAAEGERVLHSERHAVQYARTFELPGKVAVEGAEASFENGVLKLVLPKAVPAQTTRLQIR